MKLKQKKSKGARSPSRAEHYNRQAVEIRNHTKYVAMHPNHLCTPTCPKFVSKTTDSHEPRLERKGSGHDE